MNTFKTPKGTELPLMDLKGKLYLQVAHRVQWFREEHTEFTIKTEIVSMDTKFVTIKASILNAQDRVLATAHKMDQLGQDMLEKCETGAIGRALALCGYGTQFAEINEGERISDAPLESRTAPSYQKQASAPAPKAPKKDVPNYAPSSNSTYVIEVGKFKGREMSSIPQSELQSYVNFIKRKANDDGKPISGKMAEFIEHFETNDFLSKTGNPYDQSEVPPISSYDPNESLPF